MVANGWLRVRLILVCAATVGAVVTTRAQQSAGLPYAAMAERIVAALQPAAGERAILRFDPEVMPELENATRAALEKRGVKIESLEYGAAERFEERLAQTDIYIWLPTRRITPAEQVKALERWLDAGRGRQIHFHWGDGTRALDSTNGEHNAAFDRIYVDALNIDYAALDRAQEAAIRLLRSGEVHVTSPAGTDLRFRAGDRPVTKQNGDASREAMKRARVRIDREIELPAGAIRVAPIEESVQGMMVIPLARIRGVEVKGLTGC